jgi:hypothetical protein
MMGGSLIRWKYGGKILLFAVGIFLLPVLKAQATHLRAGQITVERQNCASRLFRITVTVYTDTGSGVLFGGTQDYLDFGDGSDPDGDGRPGILVPEIPHSPLPGYGPEFGFASFSTIHSFPGPGRYTISYVEPNRNEGVLNIDNSVLTTFYIETQIDLTLASCPNSPRLLIPPIDQACTGVAFFHNPGAYDVDGDSLSYELVVPYRDRNTPVSNYRDPNNQSFYSGLDYSQANEAGDGPPTFSINAIDGTLKWDAPGKLGEYNIAFVINEWRKIDGAWVKIGFVRRDMQIIVEDCNNERPKLIVPEDVCVTAGTTLNETIFGVDNTPNPTNGNLPDHHPVKIEAFSEIFATTFPSRATVSPNPAVFQPSNPPAELDFTWNTTCDHVKDQAYQVVFKISDDPPLGPSLVTFETWRITVVAPPPVLQPATVDLAKRHVDLDWDAYECQNASSMQVWRRVDDTSFTPAECQTGMPEGLGFTLIATVPIKDAQGVPITSYKDTNGGLGLSVGAKYCYRLVAVFPLPLGGESYVSNEECIDPILADAPVITHVTVDKTGATDGEITVRWTPPFDIDPVQFPGPYEYIVQRADGTGFINVSSQFSGLTFTDQGLDTRGEQYVYRIVLYSPTITEPIPQPIDTSSLASSVWLELNPQKSKIELNWSAIVPWSNQLQSYPMHRIYRGDEGATEAELVLIDSVNVIEDGFVYVDEGKLAPGDSLNGAKIYCYRVMARGGYGNAAIAEPLINFSQINCAQPIDDEDPCPPIPEPFANDCDNFTTEYGCSATNFTNTVRWSIPEGACEDDVRYYIVYVASSENGTYVQLATNVRDTFYLDNNLSSLARCYRIASVDRSNNVSELSDPICNDNCPYYELPNVFSPNGDGCNDIFSAFGVDMPVSENSDCLENPDNLFKCARFIEQVNFTVYNRWGKKVYQFRGFDQSPVPSSDGPPSIYINWDGRDDKGRELATGVYFYVAEVTFIVVNPEDRTKLIKGWVHMVR